MTAQRFAHAVPCMGTVVSFDVRGADDRVAATAVADALALLAADEARFSRFRPDSELRRLDRGELVEQECSAELRAVLALARRAERDSGGAFGLRGADGRLDLDGVVKGWSVDRALARLAAHGVEHACINAGGDIVVLGRAEPRRHWRAGIRRPEEPDRMLAVVELDGLALATSAQYERPGHLHDRRDDQAAAAWRSVSVLAPTLTEADTLATTVFALGATGLDWLARHRPAAAALAVDAAGRPRAVGRLPLARR